MIRTFHHKNCGTCVPSIVWADLAYLVVETGIEVVYIEPGGGEPPALVEVEVEPLRLVVVGTDDLDVDLVVVVVVVLVVVVLLAAVVLVVCFCPNHQSLKLMV